ncbi:hypothetical protein B0H11DRAFT_2317802 [Mycena galericulata]|nr:hypothetical protein B0H11DRAFT_2317802 [Mycena galericulata]
MHRAAGATHESLTHFSSQCGRPGCTHVFRYQGQNPFDAISKLLKEHRPHCVGRNYGATQVCAANSQLMKQSDQGAYGVSARTPRLDYSRAVHEVQGNPLPEPSKDLCRRTGSRQAVSADAMQDAKGKARKTVRTVGERKSLLENDPWIGLVDVARVVCRGCGEEISLDKRSMYYPGLWEKHRGRCPQIKAGERLPDSMIAWKSNV